jgi:hypothetical protein
LAVALLNSIIAELDRINTQILFRRAFKQALRQIENLAPITIP